MSEVVNIIGVGKAIELMKKVEAIELDGGIQVLKVRSSCCACTYAAVCSSAMYTAVCSEARLLAAIYLCILLVEVQVKSGNFEYYKLSMLLLYMKEHCSLLDATRGPDNFHMPEASVDTFIRRIRISWLTRACYTRST